MCPPPRIISGTALSAEEASESSDSDTELGEEGEHEVWRVGNHDWCTRELCGPVQRREKATVARNWMSWKTRDPKVWVNVKYYYFPCFIVWHVIVSPRFTV